MIGFIDVYTALHQGKPVRRERWDRSSYMVLKNGELMFSCRGDEPQPASSDMLDWRDMNATDWTILLAMPAI